MTSLQYKNSSSFIKNKFIWLECNKIWSIKGKSSDSNALLVQISGKPRVKPKRAQRKQPFEFRHSYSTRSETNLISLKDS